MLIHIKAVYFFKRTLFLIFCYVYALIRDVEAVDFSAASTASDSASASILYFNY